MSEEKRKVLDPHAFYLGHGGIHGTVPEEGVPFSLRPIKDLATELDAELVPGSSKSSIQQHRRQPGPGKVSGLPETDGRNVAAAGGVLRSPPPPEDEEEEDDRSAESAYQDWTKKQLRREAEKRGLEVEREDGSQAEPLAADYRRALAEDDLIREGDETEEDEDEDETD